MSLHAALSGKPRVTSRTTVRSRILVRMQMGFQHAVRCEPPETMVRNPYQFLGSTRWIFTIACKRTCRIWCTCRDVPLYADDDAVLNG